MENVIIDKSAKAPQPKAAVQDEHESLLADTQSALYFLRQRLAEREEIISLLLAKVRALEDRAFDLETQLTILSETTKEPAKP